jgi:hypothetical protein
MARWTSRPDASHFPKRNRVAARKEVDGKSIAP